MDSLWFHLTFILTFLFSLLLHLLNNLNRWRYLSTTTLKSSHHHLPLPPGDLGWPVFGNMHHFLLAFKYGDPQAFIRRYVNKYKRLGVYTAFLFGQPSILATTPEACKRVLTNDDLFETGWPESTRVLMGRKSFAGEMSKEEHQRLRRLTAASVNGQEALQRYIPRIEQFVKIMLEECAERNEVTFLKELKKLAFYVIADLCISCRPGPKCEALEKEYASLNLGIRAMPINFPGFAYNKAVKSRVRLVRLLQKVVDERRDSQGSSKTKDMLQTMMDAIDDEGNRLSDEQIIDVLIMYLNAGHESSAHTTMWVLIFLARNPQILEKVMEEQLAIRRRKRSEDEQLTIEDWRSMPYLAKVINETLRIVNISPMVFRRALCDVEFNGYVIPKGWQVLPWIRQVHLDPEVYNEPYKFDPDRWDKFAPRAGTFIPFGAGSRLCPGNELAKLEVSVFIHHMIINYTIEPVNPDCPVSYLPHPSPKDCFQARVSRRKTASS